MLGRMKVYLLAGVPPATRFYYLYIYIYIYVLVYMWTCSTDDIGQTQGTQNAMGGWVVTARHCLEPLIISLAQALNQQQHRSQIPNTLSRLQLSTLVLEPRMVLNGRRVWDTFWSSIFCCQGMMEGISSLTPSQTMTPGNETKYCPEALGVKVISAWDFDWSNPFSAKRGGGPMSSNYFGRSKRRLGDLQAAS